MDEFGVEKHSLPWHLKEELQRFKELTLHGNIVMGRKTYESLPNKNLPNRKIFVLTKDKNFNVENPEFHVAIHDINYFKDFSKDLFIAGGSEVYNAFLKHKTLRPTKILDSVYHGKIDESYYNTNADFVHINESMDIVKKNYIINKKKFYNVENVELIEWEIKNDK
jgi:dihydrofolate reductase